MSDKLKVHQEQNMKHALAVAEVNAWVGAVSEAHKRGIISLEAAEWLAGRSGEFARDLVSGGKVEGKTLEDFYPNDAPFFEQAEASLNAFKQGYPDVG